MEGILGAIIFTAVLCIFGVVMGFVYRFFYMHCSYSFGKGLSKYNRDMYDEDLKKEFDDERKMNN
jgi:hypothetical protein